MPFEKVFWSTDKVFFLASIYCIMLPIAGKSWSEVYSFRATFLYSPSCFVYFEYLTCRKTISCVDSNCALRKPSWYILGHKSFKAYLTSNYLRSFCDRNNPRHHRVHWKNSSIWSVVNDTHTKSNITFPRSFEI